MSATNTAVASRQIQVERLSMRTELVHVVRVGTMVVLAVWLYLASSLSDTGGDRQNLLPYQALVQNQPATDQRVFRELQEGLLEAESLRSTQGDWPTVESLASNGVPPFAADPTAKAAIYHWRLLREGAFVNYLGLPDRAGAPAWLVLVQEPAPGAPADQAFEDEEHHRLLDGSMLHVSTWARPNGQQVAEHLLRVPQAEGWTQLYAVTPGVRPGASS